MNDRQDEFSAPFNAVAAFPDAGSARAAVDTLAAEGISGDAVHLGATDGEVQAEMRAEMQEEVAGGWDGAPAQAKGALVGVAASTMVGAIVGLCVGIGWAILGDGPMSPLARVVMAVAVCAAGFAAAGFVGGGGLIARREAARDPERPMDDRRMVAERDVLVGIHARERQTVERAAAILRREGAERVDLVGAGGVPLPAQHEHPRPADPDGYWWGRPAQG